MADAYVREIGRLADMDGQDIDIGVDYDSITIGTPGQYAAYRWRFTQAQAEEFAQLFVAACWQAGQNAGQMAEEIHEADGGDTMAEGGSDA